MKRRKTHETYDFPDEAPTAHLPMPLDTDLLFVQKSYPQTSSSSLLSQEDRQRIEYIQMVYENRIELGKPKNRDFLFSHFFFLFIKYCSSRRSTMESI